MASPLRLKVRVERHNDSQNQKVLRRRKAYHSGRDFSAAEEAASGPPRIVNPVFQADDRRRLPIRNAIFESRGIGFHRLAETGHPAASPVPLPPDPHTAAALLKIATAFNHDYNTGDYGPVYARWDARSQAIITRAGYIRRHTDCPSAPQSARVENAAPGPQGAWLVDYEIGGQQLTDYWFYVHRRWVFDLVLSNPDAVSLYRMSAQQYVAAVGCSH